MKRFFLLIFLFCLILETVEAANCPVPTNLQVPFQNEISIKPNGRIFVNYSFDQHPNIFCYNNNTKTAGRINWPYKNILQNSNLPVLLKTKASFEGEFADSTGCIGIGNNTSNTIAVACVYGF